MSGRRERARLECGDHCAGSLCAGLCAVCGAGIVRGRRGGTIARSAVRRPPVAAGTPVITTHPRLFWALCIAWVALALMCAWCAPPLAAAPDLPFMARWQRPGVAVIRWTQSTRACLHRVPETGPSVFLGCFDAPGSYAITLGDRGPLDATARPMAHDTFLLWSAGGTRRAQLRSVARLAVVRR